MDARPPPLVPADPPTDSSCTESVPGVIKTLSVIHS